MSYAFFDNFRGFASKSSAIRYYLGNDDMNPISNVTSPRWGAAKEKEGEKTKINREGMNSPMIALCTLAGAGLLSTGLFLDPSIVSQEFLNFMNFSASNYLLSLAIAGASLLAPPTLLALFHSVLSIVGSCLNNKENFGAACSALELAQKGMAVFTDSILSLLCAAGQALYGAVSLLAAILCLIPVVNRAPCFKGVKDHLRDMSAAYLDIIAHVTSAGLSFFINMGDFVWSAKAILCCEQPLKEDPGSHAVDAPLSMTMTG